MQENEEKKRPYIREMIIKPPKSKKEQCIELVGKTVCIAAAGLVFGGTFGLGNYLVNRHITRHSEEMQETMNQLEGESTDSQKTNPSSQANDKDESKDDFREGLSTEENSSQLQETQESTSEDILQSTSEEETTLVELGVEQYQQLNQSLFEVYENVAQSFVTVHILKQEVNWLNEPIENQGETFGVILSVEEDKIIIVTSYHSIASADSLSVEVENNMLPAVLLAKDDLTDICTLQVDLRGVTLQTKLQPITLANDYLIKAGEPVILAGNPMGFCGSVVFTNLTYINRNVSITDGVCRILYTDQNQVDGASGVMLNTDGEVIGWITDNYKSSNLQNIVAGIGVNYLKDILTHLTENSDMALLGVTVVDLGKVRDAGVDVADEIKGLYVTQVLEESPAYKAGIQYGDIIQKIDDENIAYLSALQMTLLQYQPKEKVSVVVSRQGRDGYKSLSFEVELGKR